MSEVRDQPISAAGFADIGARLDGGFGCFEDGPFLYVVLSMTIHQENSIEGEGYFRRRGVRPAHAVGRHLGQ
jgi:hypothetical protein